MYKKYRIAVILPESKEYFETSISDLWPERSGLCKVRKADFRLGPSSAEPGKPGTMAMAPVVVPLASVFGWGRGCV